jgi:hypothetical protein
MGYLQLIGGKKEIDYDAVFLKLGKLKKRVP